MDFKLEMFDGRIMLICWEANTTRTEKHTLNRPVHSAAVEHNDAVKRSDKLSICAVQHALKLYI